MDAIALQIGVRFAKFVELRLDSLAFLLLLKYWSLDILAASFKIGDCAMED